MDTPVGVVLTLSDRKHEFQPLIAMPDGLQLSDQYPRPKPRTIGWRAPNADVWLPDQIVYLSKVCWPPMDW
jgi:hypothetical protein